MSAGAYAIRLALLVVVLVVAIPGLWIGLFHAMQASPDLRNTGLGFAYAAFFIGIPVWIVTLAIACWWTARARAKTVGFPFWVALSLIVLVVADWQIIFSIFQGRRPFFLYGAAVLLVALLFLPDRPSGGDGSLVSSLGHQAAIWATAVHAALATVSLAGSLAWAFTLYRPAALIEAYPKLAASWWIFALCAAMVWDIIDSRRKKHGS